MSWRLRDKTWPWQAAIVALAALTVAVGLCLFDADGAGTDSHGIARDLCGGLLVSSLTLTLLALVALSPVVGAAPRPVHVVALHRLDPPPRAIRLS